MQTLRAYLQLCRFPAVFTALADICLGFLLVRSRLAPLSDFAWLLASSAGLYLGGMVLNDVFDRRRDAVERPQRPIPSGRVSVRGAVIFGVTLLVIGVAAAAASGWNSRSHAALLEGDFGDCVRAMKWNSLIVATLLGACVLLYDGVLKATPLGPLAMGTCRALNVILGASSAGIRWTTPWLMPQAWVAAALGVYVIGITWFSRREAVRSGRGALGASALVINVGLAGLLLLAWPRFAVRVSWAGDPSAATAGVLLLAIVAVSINRRILSALSNPDPVHVQQAVKVMLLSIISLDAAIVYLKLGGDGIPYVLGIVALLVPALFAGRWLSIT